MTHTDLIALRFYCPVIALILLLWAIPLIYSPDFIPLLFPYYYYLLSPLSTSIILWCGLFFVFGEFLLYVGERMYWEHESWDTVFLKDSRYAW